MKFKNERSVCIDEKYIEISIRKKFLMQQLVNARGGKKELLGYYLPRKL